MIRFEAVLAICLVLFMAGSADAQAPTPVLPQFDLKQINQLPLPRQMHGCAVLGTRLYVFGGATTKQWQNDVQSAEVLPTGTLSPWRQERAMPEFRHYISTSIEVVNNRIYVIGGAVAPKPDATQAQMSPANDVLWTTLQPDGSLGEWKKSQPFPTAAVSCIATCSTDEHLFVLGGSAKGGISDAVLVSDLSAAGDPVNWRQSSKLPVPLWFHGSAILDDRLYVWGGLTTADSSSINTRVFAADVSRNGNLGPWQEMPPMPNGVYSSAFCGFNDYLVSIGGRYVNGVPTPHIVYSRLENGIPRTWQTLNSNLQARVYHSLGLDKTRGWIFVTGGRFRESDTNKSGPLISAVQGFQLVQPKDSQLVISKSASSSPGSPAASTIGTTAGNVKFLSVRDALTEASRSQKPILVLFYSPEVPACKRLWDEMIASPVFKSAADKFIWAAVDTSRDDRAMMSHFAIFKVPAMLLTDSRGAVLKKATRMQTAADLQQLVAGQ